MSKDTRVANGATGKTDLLLFDPDTLVIVEDEGSALRDDRAKLPYDERLVLSMMVRGVLQPVIVRKNPETDRTEVVDGRQRVKACREANKRLKKEGRDLATGSGHRQENFRARQLGPDGHGQRAEVE